jgi:hypothetical protein
MLEPWTIAAGLITGAGVLTTHFIREEIPDSIIRNARTRARTILGIGRSKMEAAPSAVTLRAAVGRGEPLPMKYPTLHCPAAPVYEILPSNDDITHIRVPDASLKKATKSRLTRRNRALLAAAAKRGEVDLRKWSIANLAKLFGASPRSVAEASKLTSKELQDVANERRPLFPARSLRELCPCSACGVSPIEEQLRAAIDVIGVQGVLDALVEAEADVTDIVEEAA